VADHVRRVRRLDDVSRFREAGGDVARLFRRALPCVAAWEHGRRVRRHRLLDVREVRQRFVADANQPRRIERALFGVGRHCGDGIALIHHLRARVFVREHRFDARRFLRRGEIDSDDARVG
jgi:hypothetical protein